MKKEGSQQIGRVMVLRRTVRQSLIAAFDLAQKELLPATGTGQPLESLPTKFISHLRLFQSSLYPIWPLWDIEPTATQRQKDAGIGHLIK